MIQKQLDKAVTADIRSRKYLDASLREMSEECIECKICVKQCAFLSKYGTPKMIADDWQARNEQSLQMAFACSLCSLCTAVCPVGIDPRRMFLEIRRYSVAAGRSDLTKQRQLLNFESRGTSKRYSFYGLPVGCDTVLFPGCALAGSRPQRVMQMYDHLRNYYPNLGIVLDCCTKPSHDLGRSAYFQAMFSEMQQYLVGHGIKKILLACPSCYAVFSKYGGLLTALTIYDILAREYWQPVEKFSAPAVTIQDSCVARNETDMHKSVRKLIQAHGVSYEEMKHHGKKTLCCGEGGGANFVEPELAGSWAETRRAEVQNRRIITYCAGCAIFLGKVAPTTHLLDLLFDPAPALAGRVKVAKAPFTYLNRLLLKWQLKRKMKYGCSRERTYICSEKEQVDN
jgi:Fe-S oxidoreductase